MWKAIVYLSYYLCSLRSLMGFLAVQMVLGVPDRLVVPDRVSLARLNRLLDDASAEWSHLHQVSSQQAARKMPQ